MRLNFLFVLVLARAFAQSPAGDWSSNLKDADSDYFVHLQLKLEGTKLTGKFGNFPIQGTFENARIEAIIKPNPVTTIHLHAIVDGDHIQGDGTIEGQKLSYKWEATRASEKSTPQSHVFDPAQFQHFFSDATVSGLHIRPGDTVSTWSVDAGGVDKNGVRLTTGGNPLTGPFYVDGALPGDTLVVHINRLHLNRDTAFSGAMIASRALEPSYVLQRKSAEGNNVDWKLDRAAGVASLAHPSQALKNYQVPLAPMLGCVGVAPPGGMRERSAFLGSYGGNLDYNQIREGVTIYLPVFAPGALLFIGDGHAAQGAGELTGNALETSMDIEFTVNVQNGGAPDFPRMENSDYLMASGVAGSLDEAFRAATTNLARWLEQMQNLNAAEVSSVLTTAIIYDIAEVVDPQTHIVAKVPKSITLGLAKPARP